MGSLVRSQILIAYSKTTVRLIVMWVSAIFDRRSAALVEKLVDESGYHRAGRANEATHHTEQRDCRPRVSRGTRQTNQIAGQRKIHSPIGKTISIG